MLGIDNCDSAKTGKTAAARIGEEWQLLVLGLGIDGGQGPLRWWSRVKMVSATGG